MKSVKHLEKYLPYAITFIFFVAYTILTIIRHNHFQSFGFDLGIIDQIVWKYSMIGAPITTIDHVAFISELNVHVEIIYALLAPFYWLWSDARMLITLQNAAVCSSAIAIYLLAKTYKVHVWIQYALLFTYLVFYGVQNALWFDVHSATFATAFIAWFIYFLVTRNKRWAIVFFLLAITAKENIAGITFLISIVYFIAKRNKASLYFAVASVVYLAFIFGIYFPYIAEGYRFQKSEGLFSNFDPMLMVNTKDKIDVYFYTLLSYGFLPLLSPLYLIPPLGNLASYFILGSNVSTAQGLFLQYRVELVPLMSWVTIVTVAKFSWLNRKYIALYLVICAMLVQYFLHLPLSYLAKSWFWTPPTAGKQINTILDDIPDSASVVSQNNITPHVSQREVIVTLWPIKKDFSKDSPCGETTCDWFRWEGKPQYLIVDLSPEWDARHLLTNNSEFKKGVENLEKANIIKVEKRLETTTLYRVLKNP